jgi:predicted transcriptional regulator
MTKTINQTIIILNEIRELTNINRTEKELLCLISQLDNQFSCTAFNEYLSQALNCSKVYIQKMLAKLIKLGYLTRQIINGYVRKIKSIFSHLYKKSIRGGIQEYDNKENIDKNSTTQEYKNRKNEKGGKIKDYLDTEISEQDQVDYQSYIEKKGDYNDVNYSNLYFHKGWIKWFKIDQKAKEKGKTLSNLLINARNRFTKKFSIDNI